MKTAERGFTLVELMIAILIVGILVGIAIPSYRGYVLRATRAEAKQQLLARASDLERCYTKNNTYLNAATTPCNVVTTFPAAGLHYTITAPTLTANTFSLLATPTGGQAKDTLCNAFTLDDKNSRGVTGSSPVQDCWGR